MKEKPPALPERKAKVPEAQAKLPDFQLKSPEIILKLPDIQVKVPDAQVKVSDLPTKPQEQVKDNDQTAKANALVLLLELREATADVTSEAFQVRGYAMHPSMEFSSLNSSDRQREEADDRKRFAGALEGLSRRTQLLQAMLEAARKMNLDRHYESSLLYPRSALQEANETIQFATTSPLSRFNTRKAPQPENANPPKPKATFPPLATPTIVAPKSEEPAPGRNGPK